MGQSCGDSCACVGQQNALRVGSCVSVGLFIHLLLTQNRQVYWGNGCQIIPPHDEGIAQEIMANLELWELPKVRG
jgi:hypothetical protein